jgi:hypothetical protein
MRRVSNRSLALLISLAIGLLFKATPAAAIDFYEIQIYSPETTPKGVLELELHSNSVTTATGSKAHAELRPYEIHETLEATYGLTPHIEIGQYLATAKLGDGNYEYAGARTKIHFGLAASESWPFQVGGNVELDYMRKAAEENPLSLELRPIVARRFGRFWLVCDFTVSRPFQGQGTHKGFTFEPSGLVSYDLFPWLTPAIEYYGDMGAIEHLPALQDQQHFIVPALDLYLLPRLELNLGVGLGLTHASNGVFVKSIVGWAFGG